MRSKLLAVFLVVVAMLSALPPERALAATIRFNFVFVDPPGVGFNHPSLGGPARRTLEAAGVIWGARLAARYPGETITVLADFALDRRRPGSHARATAWVWHAVPGVAAARPHTFYPLSLVNHLSGRDVLRPGQPLFGRPGSLVTVHGQEITVSFNPAVTWAFGAGPRPNPTPGGVDFLAVALHEIGHGLGFSSLLAPTGGYRGLPTIYDRFLVDARGVRLVAMPPAERLRVASTPGAVFWAGPAGVRANGGQRPAIYTRGDGFVVGSSLVHTRVGSVMDPVPRLRRLDPVTLGMLQDIGWSLAPAPLAHQTAAAPGGQALALAHAAAEGPAPAPVPLPAPLLLVASGLAALVAARHLARTRLSVRRG